jgi:hypothetical protein
MYNEIVSTPKREKNTPALAVGAALLLDVFSIPFRPMLLVLEGSSILPGYFSLLTLKANTRRGLTTYLDPGQYRLLTSAC